MTLQRSNYKACYTAGNLRNSAITICHSKSSPIPEGPKVVSDLPTNHFNTISRIKLHSSTRVGSLWVHGTTPGYVYWSITMTTKVTYMMTAKESPALFIYISGATHFVLNEWFIHFTKVDRTLGLDSKLARGSKSKTIRRNKHCWGYCPSESQLMNGSSHLLDTYMMTAKESPALFIYISGATHFVLNEWFIHFTKVDRTLGLDSKLARGSKSKTIRRNKHCWGYCPSESQLMNGSSHLLDTSHLHILHHSLCQL